MNSKNPNQNPNSEACNSEAIEKLLQPLKERGRFKTPEEVDEYFKQALTQTANDSWNRALESAIKALDKTDPFVFPFKLYKEITDLINKLKI